MITNNRKTLIQIGKNIIHEASPVYKNIFKETDSLTIWLDKCACRASLLELDNLLTFLRFRDDIAMSLLLFYNHPETVEMHKHLSIRKQFQLGMKHFCPLVKAWSKRDLSRYYDKNQNLWFKHTRLKFVRPYGEALSKDTPLKIWFLSDKLLESLIFAIKSVDYGIVGFDCCKIKHPNASRIQKKVSSHNFRNQVIDWLSSKNPNKMTTGEILLEFSILYTPTVPELLHAAHG